MRSFSWLSSLSPQASAIGTELGQAKFRVINVTPFCLYLVLAWYFKWQAVPVSVVIGAVGYIAYAVIWVAVVRFSILNTTLRRTLATILDQALPALGMYLAGFLAGLVAWVPTLGAIGNGLRFGTRYTWLSSAVCGPLMGAAFYFSPDWQTIPGVATGIVLINVLVPLYVVVLVKRMEQDKQAFEQRAAHFEEATKHDHLTGLLNRAGFADVFDELFKSGAEQREMSAVLLLDLDGFKAINDGCGHAAGDEILKAVAMSLSACVRISDKVARLGGDEFGILLRHVTNEKNVELVAEKILNAMREIAVPRHDLRLGASIGICVLPDPDLHTYDDVLKAADRLMYEAKAAGKHQFRSLAA
ncbi:GGDEF domain-containing protein [Herminiimonas arsenitoxidans]|uniref:GGDEF domain-containing protein n=1 Tax=Herminiimonas arsenitoxidans TaxID=1809410 RepID=UPI0009704471|nr:GGDEF domain-containing protein [Herminiimonas arsenitoxidans]